MKKKVIFLFFVCCISAQPMFSQQADHIQRGQRGYVPPPRYIGGTYIDLKDPQEESNLIMSKCVTKFNLDDFQKEILKSMLIKKIEDENIILRDKANSREDRKKKIADRNNLFYKELASILTQEQVDDYKIMDFSETAEEKKEKKKKRKKDKRKKTGS